MIPPVCRRAFPVLAVAALLFVGCEGSDSDSGSNISWNSPATATTKPASATPTTVAPGARTTATTQPSKQSTTQPTQPSSSGTTSGGSTSSSGNDSSTPPPASSPTVGDAVSYNSFHWDYGGTTKPRGARQSGVVISGLSFSKTGLSFTYQTDLSAWGHAYTDPAALACLFVKDNNGRWVGGKFDWISSSRRSRNFENIFNGYSQWSLANVPNPCQAAFVIASSDGKRRSNVLAGVWSR